VRFLLDTNALLWLLAGSERVDEATRSLLADPRNAVFVSVVSVWEIVIKVALGKLDVPRNVASWLPDALTASRLTLLPITLNHPLGVERLPPHHSDPFDRLLIAQAMTEDMIIVTSDAEFARYEVRIIRC
jgi:PIN domain nuclease of toxin-antitoxin system